MFRALVDMILALSGPMYFSSPKIGAPSPMPAAPTEDPAAEAQRENVRRAAVVDLLSTGRRSTMSAGKTLTDESFLQTVKPSKRRAVTNDLGLM